jgi:hypothetical protein
VAGEVQAEAVARQARHDDCSGARLARGDQRGQPDRSPPWMTTVEPMRAPPLRVIHEIPFASGVNCGKSSAGVSVLTG